VGGKAGGRGRGGGKAAAEGAGGGAGAGAEEAEAEACCCCRAMRFSRAVLSPVCVPVDGSKMPELSLYSPLDGCHTQVRKSKLGGLIIQTE